MLTPSRPENGAVRVQTILLAALILAPLGARAADLVVWWRRYTVAPPWRVGLTTMLLGVFTVAVAPGG
jgi:hypothetical protein